MKLEAIFFVILSSIFSWPTLGQPECVNQTVPIKNHMLEIYQLMDGIYVDYDKPEKEKILLNNLESIKGHLHAVFFQTPPKFAELSLDEALSQKIEFQNYIAQTLVILSQLELAALALGPAEIRREKLGALFEKLNRTVGNAHLKMRGPPEKPH
jgi:hypothetical protein